MTTIIPAFTRANFTIITDLASTIWTEHYTPIIGAQQVAYMLEKFQSVPAIQDQVEKGIRYYLIKHQDIYAGYLSFSIEENHLFLSKLYVQKSARGNKIGKAALSFIEEQAKTIGLYKIRLTVNKYNSNAIKAYEKMGFINVEAIVQDIGNGFVMDDYVLEKNIS